MSNDFSIKAIIRAVDKFSPTMKRMAANMDHFGKLAKGMGKGMTTNLSAPIAAFGGLTLKTAVDFEAAMNRVEALSGETGDSLGAMRKMAENLGSSTAFSASEAAGAMGFLAQAGWKANQILGGTPAMLDLAAASGSDLARSADIASKIMGQFGIQANNAARVADVLAATTASANVDMETMAQSMKSAGPIANMYGLTLEDTASAIGLLGNVGIQGDVAGTALKNTMLALVNPTGDAGKMLKWLGVQTKDAKGNMLPLVDVLASFGTALDKAGIGEGQKLAAIQTLFGKEGLAGATELLAKAKSGALREYAASLANVEGRARSMAATMMKGAPGAVKNLASAFEGLQLAIAKSGLLEWFTKAVEGVTGFIKSLSATNPELLKLGTVVAGVVAVAGPTIWALGAMASGFASITTAAAALKVALLANPITAIAAGIAAAAYIIYDNWDGIVSWFTEKFDAIKSAFSDGLLKGMWKAWKELNPVTMIFEALDGLISYLTGFDLSGFLMKQLQTAVDVLPDWAKEMMGVDGLQVAAGASVAAQVAAAPQGGPVNYGVPSALPRIAQAASGKRTGGETRIVVSFEDVPPGTRINSSGMTQRDVELIVERTLKNQTSFLGAGRGYAFSRYK